MSKRHDEIYRRYLAGEPINDIAKAYGVIGMRIKQIISKKKREIEKETKPLPCIQDEHGEIRAQTVRQLVAKIDEELNEMKAGGLLALYMDKGGITAEQAGKILGIPEDAVLGANMLVYIAEEAADTITAITTLLEALGVDDSMRAEAQRRVNQKNHERGRLFLTTAKAED